MPNAGAVAAMFSRTFTRKVARSKADSMVVKSSRMLSGL